MRLTDGKHVVLVIPDLQAPFQHPDALKFLCSIRDLINPTKIVCIGDSMDFHFASRFPKDPDGYSANEEYKRGLKFMAQFYKEFPIGVEVDSNHNNRIYKTKANAGLPSVFNKSMREMLKAPNTWDFVKQVEIDGIVYQHGDKLPGGMYGFKKAPKEIMRSVVMGHHHSSAGIAYVSTEWQMIFGMNVGCLIDSKAYAFKYADRSYNTSNLCCGAVMYGAPMLFPMKLNKAGRWIGKL